MITVSSCGVKLQEVLSGLERERLKHWRYTCTLWLFSTLLYYYFSFHLGCNGGGERCGSLIFHNSVQGEFPEGLVEVCQPLALLEDNPPLYGVSATGIVCKLEVSVISQPPDKIVTRLCSQQGSLHTLSLREKPSRQTGRSHWYGADQSLDDRTKLGSICNG